MKKLFWALLLIIISVGSINAQKYYSCKKIINETKETVSNSNCCSTIVSIWTDSTTMKQYINVDEKGSEPEDYSILKIDNFGSEYNSIKLFDNTYGYYSLVLCQKDNKYYMIELRTITSKSTKNFEMDCIRIQEISDSNKLIGNTVIYYKD